MPVSIFNHVIGPVMRGPSSSHCAAGLRIGRLARDLMGEQIKNVLVEYDREGSLATTHESQGSDMGLCGGLMGWDTADERVPESVQKIQDAGIDVSIVIKDFHDDHPNTYRLTLSHAQAQHRLKAISTGGGMVEVTEIDGFPVSLLGDYQETLIFLGEQDETLKQHIANHFDPDEVLLHEDDHGQLLQIKAQSFLDPKDIMKVCHSNNIQSIAHLNAVLPIRSCKPVKIPFSTCDNMLHYDNGRNLPLWELAVQYESQRGNLSHDKVLAQMIEIVQILRTSIKQGIDGTSHADRILGHQSGSLKTHMANGSLLDAGILNHVVLYVTALMEVKSAMGVIVAAPTAGACAALPGACMAVADAMGLTDEDAAKALLAGGLIGMLVATKSTFAAEVCGCQAECGVASGMAAAALVSLIKGTASQAITATSMAFQNCLGMICDPVANRVEVPCLGKNVMAATNALTCANMALAGYDPVIPLDQVIDTMDMVGRSIPRELRCTALGGLSITPTSRAIEDRLKGCKKTC